MKLINKEDYTKPDGDVDWVAYKKAQIAVGERCPTCRQHIIPAAGKEQHCYSCRKLLEAEGEGYHETFVRCPSCKAMFDPTIDANDIYAEGDHEVTFTVCKKKFTIE